jgi:signal transduction histidine kinase
MSLFNSLSLDAPTRSPVDERSSRLTTTLLLVGNALAIGLCVVLAIIVPSWPVTFWTNVAIGIVSLLLLLLVRRGHAREAGAIAFVTMSLAIAADSLNPARSFGLAAPVVPLLIVFMALIYGTRGMVLSVIFSCAWVAGVIVIKRMIWEQPLPMQRMQMIDGSAYGLYFVATAVVIGLAQHVIQQARERELRIASDLADKNVRLEREMSERRNAERAQAQRSTELARLLDISNTLTSTLELGPLLDLTLIKLHDVVDFDEAFIAAFSIGGTHDAQVISIAGNADPSVKGKVLRYDASCDGALTQMIASKQAIVMLNLAGDDTYTASFRTWFVRNLGVPKRAMASAMLVPLVVKDNLLGMLVICTSRKGYYKAHLADLALAFANQSAVAIDNAHMHAAAVHAAAIKERTRLARELHDSVSQSLYGIVLGTRTAMLTSDDPQRVSEALEYVLKLAESGLTEMRACIFELRPEQLQEGGVGAALQRQIEALCVRHSITLSVAIPAHESDLPLYIKESVYRIGLEAAHNAIKHAHAKAISLMLTQNDGMLQLTLTDDGRGFDPNQHYVGHLGLQGMHERATEIGGTLSIDSVPGRGATVTLQVPWAR